LPQLRSAVLTNYAEIARSVGLDPLAQLRAARIDPECLRNPDLKIPIERAHVLLESSAHAARVEDFGLRMAMSRRLSNLGLIALVAREEPTLRDALRCVQRTMPLHNEALYLDIEDSNDVAVVRERLLARLKGSTRQATELAIGVLYRFVQELLGAGWRPTAVCFTHGPPRDISRYRKAFNCSVQFNGVLNGLVLRCHDLDRPMPKSDPASLRILRQYLATAAQYRPTQRDRTTHLILALLASGRCSAELVASYLGIDRRTLHRRLTGEGTSFSQLLDDVRKEAARRTLANPEQPIADLAPILGFSDGSAFTRWFSAKFGASPRRWQRQTSSESSRGRVAAANSRLRRAGQMGRS